MLFQRITRPKIAMGPFGTIAGKLANSSCMVQHIQEPINGMELYFSIQTCKSEHTHECSHTE